MGASLPFLVTILSALLFSDGGVPVETASLQFEQLKAGMKSAWMAGDFGEVAKFTSAEAENFVARIGIQPGARVLDVACGTGNTAIPAARGGAEVTGVDIATNLLAQAEKRAKVEGLRAHFQEGDAEHLPFGDSEFDVVLSMYGAMFAPRPDRVAAELVRVCKPGEPSQWQTGLPKVSLARIFALRQNTSRRLLEFPHPFYGETNRSFANGLKARCRR